MPAVRISKGLGKATDLDVYFDDDDPDAVLHITYRPTSFTPAQLDEIRNNSDKDARRLVEATLNVVAAWDLTNEDETPIPLELDAVYGIVPTSILGQILKAVNEDQTPVGKEN